MMKRMIAGMLVTVMILSFTCTAAFQAEKASFENFQTVNTYTNDTFSDLTPGAWYEENVKRSYELGLFVGKGNQKFDPQGKITIGEAVTIAARIHKIYNTGSMLFENTNPWYKSYFDYAKQNGIIEKDAFTNLNQNATRAQFAYIITNALPEDALEKINSITTGDIPDVSGNEYFAQAVYRLYNAGIMVGNDGYGSYKPYEAIERCAVVAIVTRMTDKSLRMKKTLAPLEIHKKQAVTDDFYITLPTGALEDLYTVQIEPNSIQFYETVSMSMGPEDGFVFAVEAHEENDLGCLDYGGVYCGKIKMNDGHVLIVVLQWPTDVRWNGYIPGTYRHYYLIDEIAYSVLETLKVPNGIFIPDKQTITEKPVNKNTTWQEDYEQELNASAYWNTESTKFGRLGQYYSLYDIDKNGTPELFILYGTCMADYKWDVYSHDLGFLGTIDGARMSPIIGVDGENAFCVHDVHQGLEYIKKYTLCNEKLTPVLYIEHRSDPFMDTSDEWYDQVFELKECEIFEMDAVKIPNWKGNNDSGNRRIIDNLY